jgi:hypothetical protein
MRVLFGMVLGALLIVSAAFIADSWSAGSAPTTTGSAAGTVVHRPMVNWDVVGENLRIARQRTQEGWNRLSQKIVH